MEYYPVTAAAQATALQSAAAGGSVQIFDGATLRCTVDLETVAFDRSNNVLTARGGDGTNPISGSNRLVGVSATTGAWTHYIVRNSADANIWRGDDDDMTLSAVGDEVQITAWTITVPQYTE